MVTRVLLGKFPAGDNSPNGYGLRISEAGYEVTVANPDNERLVFNSDWPAVLPIHKAGPSVSVNNATVRYSFPDLGYTPFVSALVKLGDRDWEAYTTSNALVKTSRAATAVTNVDCFPQGQLAYSGDTFTNLRLAVFPSYVDIYCNSSVSVYPFIYKMRAF
jgi:hypothetical protein